jgi:nucleotide-binding universal stress UspA family protein
MDSPRDTVVIGLDASPDSGRALDWAAAEAARRGLPLHLIHALEPVFSELPLTAIQERERHETAERLLVEARAQVGRSYPVAVHAEVVDRPAVPAVLAAARSASLVVLGARGHGVIHGLLLGSVSRHVSQHAPCPVVVVRERADPRQDRILVGVDGSPGSQDALGFAMEHAGRRNAPVLAVYGWHERDLGASSMVTWTRAAERIAAAERMLEEALGPWRSKHPDVELSGEAVPVHPARLLADGSEHAGLVVVGSRGRGEFAGLLLGSVSQEVLQHARCPVAVVHRRT